MVIKRIPLYHPSSGRVEKDIEWSRENSIHEISVYD